MFLFLSRLFRCLLLWCTFASTTVIAQSTVEAELLRRITDSKNGLLETQQKISAKSRSYAQKLEQKERAVKELRTQVAAQQRVADEQLISMEKLQQRVEQWETQSNYQAHMLRHFHETVGMSVAKESDSHILDQIVARAEFALNPNWRAVRVISAGGQIVEAPVLKLGPVELALDEQTRSAGLLVRESGLEARIIDVFDRSQQQELWTMHTEGLGYYPFDPTLGNALQLRNHGEGPLEHLRKGGIWAIPIVFFGLLSLLITLLKASQFLRLPKVDRTLIERLQQTAQQSHSLDDLKVRMESAIAGVGPTQHKLAQIALNNPVSQQRDDLLVAYLMENKHLLEKYMGVVAISAAIAPLLGLLGTVSGMIDTFKMMTIFGSGDASTVSGGISEALITTELGLIVAIPSLIVSALLTRHIKSYTHKLENFAIKLSKIPLGR